MKNVLIQNKGELFQGFYFIVLIWHATNLNRQNPLAFINIIIIRVEIPNNNIGELVMV